MSTKTFQTAGSWLVAGNWDGGIVPIAGDAVVIAAECALDVDTPALASLKVNSGVTLDAGNYDIATTGDFDLDGTLTAGSGTISVGGDLDWSGTFTRGTSTVALTGTGLLKGGSASRAFYDLSIAASGQVTTLYYNYPEVHHQLILGTGTVNVSGGGWITLRGTGTVVSNAGATMNVVLMYRPASAGTVNVAGGNYNAGQIVGLDVTDSNLNVDFVLAGDLSCPSLLVQNQKWGDCTFDANDYDITTTGDCTLGSADSRKLAISLGSGTLDVGGALALDQTSGGGNSIALEGSTVKVTGDVSVDAGITLTGGTSLLIVRGNGVQTASLAGKTYHDVEMQNGHGRRILYLPDGFTAAKLTLPKGARVRFGGTKIYTLTEIDWQGGSSPQEWLELKSTADDSAWSLTVSGTQAVKYVAVRDSNASGGSSIGATDRGFDLGGNSNWSFPSSNVTQYRYDQVRRLAKVQDAEGGATYFEYDLNGNRAKVIDPVANPTYFAYDGVNRLVSVKAADLGETLFGYDKVGNRLKEQNPIGKVTYYQYDVLNRLKTVIDPLQEAAYYEFDAVGNLTRSQSPENRVGQFAYDAVNRRTVAGYNDGFAAYFGYDTDGNMLAAKEAAQGVVYFDYDELHRVAVQKFAAGAGGGAAYYAYDPDSNRTVLQYPSGGTAYYTFDEASRMTSVKAPSGNLTSFTFDEAGNRTKSVWGNASFTYYDYDDAFRNGRIRHFKSDGTPLAYFDYDRDLSGDITKIARLDGITTYYGYDVVKRLTGETWKDSGGSPIYGFQYGYDLAGNRIAAVLQGDVTYYSYNDAGAITHRQDSAGHSYYYHDDDGNLTTLVDASSGATYFEHSAAGLITKIKGGGDEVEFGYDALTRRIWARQGGETTYFKHDGINLLEVTTSAGSVTKLVHGFVVIPGIGSVVEVDKDGTRYFLLIDHRGTCYMILDASGVPVWTGLCDAWGKALSEIGTNPTIFWYQGQAWWKLTVNGRLFYVSAARIFDVQDGRFIERDPLGKPEFENRLTAFGEAVKTTAAIQQRYIFAGREASANASAGAPMYYRNRQYFQGLGRFGRRDPRLGGDPLYNAYGFPGSNAVMITDASGKGKCCTCDEFVYFNPNGNISCTAANNGSTVSFHAGGVCNSKSGKFLDNVKCAASQPWCCAVKHTWQCFAKTGTWVLVARVVTVDCWL